MQICVSFETYLSLALLYASGARVDLHGGMGWQPIFMTYVLKKKKTYPWDYTRCAFQNGGAVYVLCAPLFVNIYQSRSECDTVPDSWSRRTSKVPS